MGVRQKQRETENWGAHGLLNPESSSTPVTHSPNKATPPNPSNSVQEFHYLVTKYLIIWLYGHHYYSNHCPGKDGFMPPTFFKSFHSFLTYSPGYIFHLVAFSDLPWQQWFLCLSVFKGFKTLYGLPQLTPWVKSLY